MQKLILFLLLPVVVFAQIGTDTRLGKFDQIDSNTATGISILKELEALTTGAWKLPIGNTAARPVGTAGQIRYNSELLTFEGYTDAWGPIAGGGGLIVWETALDLEVGDLVYRDYNKKIYRVITLHTTTSTFDEAKMIEIANSSDYSLLKNPDFENTIVEYACTNATGAFVDTTLPIYNNFKMFQMTVSTIGGYCDFTTTTGAALEGLLFKMGAMFQTTLAGVDYCTLVNGAVDNCIPVSAGTPWTQPLNTQSIAGATSVGVRVRSTTVTGVVNVDKLHLSMGGLPTGPTVSCNGDLDCENRFTAFVTGAGVVSQETGGNWINGSGVAASPSITLTLTSGFLTNGMNCNATGAERTEIRVFTSSSTTIRVDQYNSAGSALLGDFFIECTKTGTDFKPITQQGVLNVGTAQGALLVVTNEGVTTNQAIGNATITVPFDTVKDSRGITWDIATEEATFLQAGKYEIQIHAQVFNDTANSTGLMFPEIDKGAGFITIPEDNSKCSTFINTTAGRYPTHGCVFVVNVKGGEKIRLRATGNHAGVSLINSASNYPRMTIRSVVDQQTIAASVATNYVSGGAEVLTADTWDTEPIYRRCYEVASNITTNSTITTIDAGLNPVEALGYFADTFLITGSEAGSSFSQIRYIPSTGAITATVSGSGFIILAGTRFCFKYYK